MSLLGFAYFVTVAKEGNISRAACVSNSAVLGEDKVPLNESEANKNFI